MPSIDHNSAKLDKIYLFLLEKDSYIKYLPIKTKKLKIENHLLFFIKYSVQISTNFNDFSQFSPSTDHISTKLAQNCLFWVAKDSYLYQLLQKAKKLKVEEYLLFF